MNRRTFLKDAIVLTAATGLSKAASGLSGKTAGYYSVAAAILPRHSLAEEIFPVLTRYKERGFTGVWVENDYLRWNWNTDPDQGFGGNWRLFNIFDFTFSKHKALYQDYLLKLCGKCTELNLSFYASFWMPKLNAELRDYLAEHSPQALGSCISGGKHEETLCCCRGGAGLIFLEDMVSSYMKLSPAIRGLKIATLDNNALVCDETCPHAHGTTRAEHIANMYGAIQKAMRRERYSADLFVYEWFWEPDYLAEVQKQITQPYFLITKMEMGSRQHLETLIPGSPLFDASNLTGEEGVNFKEAVQRLGASRVVDLPAMGSGNDDIFFGSPPFPGRVHRRMQLHRKIGCDKVLEFECGSHWDDSNELAFAIFQADPGISQDDLLNRVAARIYKREDARKFAIAGWRAFDEGFSYLPVGVGDTNCKQISGRFGYAWTMCIATPLVREVFGDSDQKHFIHWFSPYNFFNSTLVDRLETQFLRTQSHWEQALQCLTAASALEGDSPKSKHEAIGAEGHLLGVVSALNWCNACRYARTPSRAQDFNDLALLEINVTKRFRELSSTNVWLWNNICWHPHQTPMSQIGLGFEGLTTRNTFDAKLQIMGNP